MILAFFVVTLTHVTAIYADTAAPTHELGRKVYHKHCYYCHGYGGDGATTAGVYLSPRPRSFTQLDARQIDHKRMSRIVAGGSPNTAMQPFGSVLTKAEIGAVIDFIVAEFVLRQSRGPRYHEYSAGWSSEFSTDRFKVDQLDPAHDAVCLTCHESRLSIDSSETSRINAVSAASPYAVHDQAPTLRDASPQVIAGGDLYQANCAFCHARDGSGRNWIGNFLEPHARDLRSAAVCNPQTLAALPSIVRDGLPGTSMPAWRDVLSKPQIAAISAYVEHAFCVTKIGFVGVGPDKHSD